MENLSKWMDEKQMGAEVLRTTAWGEIGFGRLSKNLLDQMTPPLETFFKTMTKSELGQGAIERRILLFPVNDTKDVFNHPQLLARDFFREVTIGEQNDKLKIPGPFITATGSPLSSFKRAPTIGEHNLEVYSEIGLTSPEIDRLVEESII
jgi:crotonobetainyl-CoA:carnitine CoA-transferase CaiB-like acyl-CoA transferase